MRSVAPGETCASRQRDLTCRRGPTAAPAPRQGGGGLPPVPACPPPTQPGPPRAALVAWGWMHCWPPAIFDAWPALAACGPAAWRPCRRCLAFWAVLSAPVGAWSAGGRARVRMFRQCNSPADPRLTRVLASLQIQGAGKVVKHFGMDRHAHPGKEKDMARALP